MTKVKTTASKEKLSTQLDASRLPRHVAIIMDGNGRWAKARGFPRVMGHRQGIKSVRASVEQARELDIEILTLYAFSVENWKRPSSEVTILMQLLNEYLRKELDDLIKHEIRLNVLGDFSGLPEVVQRHLSEVMTRTRGNQKMVLNLALNYGARTEILQAVNRLVEEAKAGKLSNGPVDEKSFSRYLYTGEMPDPDLLIRTSGEQRISNFLLWQISYAELYLTETLWPDFGKDDFVKAIVEYQRRDRRYGA